MSIPQKMTVNCSKCGKSLSATVFESVNSDYTDDIAVQIMSGDLFNVECPHCKFISHLEYDILYHDLRHGAMIWVVHNNSPEYTKRVSEIRTIQKLPYKTFRIVEDMNALKEKVSCLESNRDDRIVELCKVFTAYNLLSQRPDFELRNAFYTAVSGKELIYLYDNENNELCCELPEKAYDYLKNLFYGSHYATQIDDNYPIIDYKWAENVLIPLIEAKANNLPSNDEADRDIEPINDTSTNDKKVCPECKAALPSDSKFCQGCGTKLSVPDFEPVQSIGTNEELLSEFDIAEIQKERNLAILKRAATTELTNKKEKRIKRIIICVIAVIVAFFIVKGTIDNAHNSEPRNFATQTMSDDYTNVYADVVSMDPEYFVYRYNTTKYGTKIGNGDLWEVVCRCKTVEGKTIWATFFYQYYPESDYSDNEDDYKSFTYSSDNPLTLVGSVDTAYQVVHELEDAIGNVFVLDVREKPKHTHNK